MKEQTKKPSVVLIDDSLTECKAVSQILINEGLNVTYFDNAFAAIEHINRHEPDIIVSDVVMPDMDGFEVCKYIKSNDHLSHIPVILLTGLDSSDAIVKGFDAGAFDFVNKSDSKRVWVSRIKACIDYHNSLKKQMEISEHLEILLKQRTELLVKAERQCIFAQFIQGIIHNLKNPLSAISGFAEVNKHYLEKLAKDNNDKSISVISHNNTLIFDAIENVFRTIHSLLKKGKETASDKKEMIELNDFLTKELSFFESNLFFSSRVKKTMNFHPEPINVFVVPTVISQVFENMISNAIDALKEEETPALEISTGHDDQSIWFQIKDNGHGIDKATLPHLFDAFFSTKHQGNESNQSYSGSGLGLFICKEMVESNDGKIEVDSKKGEFTLFKISLPYIKGE